MASAQGGEYRWWALLVKTLAFALLLWPLPALAEDKAGQVIENLRRSRSFKVRVQAATVLSRMQDERVIPELARAAAVDRTPAVRIVALGLLARLPVRSEDEAKVRSHIRRARSDRRGDVRQAAQRAMKEFDRGRVAAAAPPRPAPPRSLVVALGSVADRTGRARPQLRSQLRTWLAARLRENPKLSVSDVLSAGLQPSYIIDASIARLDHGSVGPEVQSSCAVQLIISRPPRGIIMVASGEASVLRPRTQFRNHHREAMDSEASQHAVASAHQDLVRFLSSAQ